MVGESLVVGNESSYKAWVDLAVEEGPDLFSGLVFFSIKSPNVFFFLVSKLFPHSSCFDSLKSVCNLQSSNLVPEGFH